LDYYSEEERKRYSIFEEFYVYELEWSQIRVMNEYEFKNLQDNLASLEKEIVLVKNRQPDCAEFLEGYENEFSKYITEVQRILELNDNERFQLDHCLFSEEKIETLRKTLDSLIKIRNKNWDLLDNRTIEYSTKIIWHLISLRNEVETDKSKFFPTLEKARETLEKNNSVLYELLDPTHNWIIFELQSKKRCSKCSKEIMLEEKENKFHYEEELQKKRKPIRDPDGYLPPA
jgi:hypothetical protein